MGDAVDCLGVYGATQQGLNKVKHGWTKPEYIHFRGQVVAEGNTRRNMLMSIGPCVKSGKVWKRIFGFTMRRGYIRACDTARHMRYILDIRPAKIC
jgi:hypothetical protein